jgi:hypothetical protein
MITLAVLGRWLPPNLTGKDAGDFATAVGVLGVPHPTGYPLYCLLGKAFSLLVPWGNLAWRLGLFSAVTTAVGVGLLYLALVKMPLPTTSGPARTPIAVASALLVGVTPTLASQSIIPEVYPLLFLQAVLLLWLALAWARRPHAAMVVGFAFVAGLGLSNHLTFGLLLPGVLTYGALRHWTELRRLLSWRVLLGALGAFAAGLLPYLYIPLRSRLHPPLDWAGADSAGAFWRHVTGAAYVSKWAGFDFEALSRHLGFVGSNFPGPLSLALVVGVAWLAVRGRTLLLLLGGCALTVVAFAVGYQVVDSEHMQTGALPFLGALFFVGAAVLVGFLPGRWRAAAAWLLLVAPLGSVLVHGVELDRSADDRTYRRIHILLDALPADALVITSGDFPIIPAWYAQIIEGTKPDVAFLHDSLPFRHPSFLEELRRRRPDLRLPEPDIRPDEALYALILAMEVNLDRVPVYATAMHASFHQRFVFEEIPVMPGSRLWRVRRR